MLKNFHQYLARLVAAVCLVAVAFTAQGAERPWSHGPLRVSDNHRFLCHTDGTPFFWLGDTGWLLPERLDRDETAHYLRRTAEEGFNVVQIQVINGVPAYNSYGAPSHPDGWNLAAIDSLPGYGYWDHLDYIVSLAEREGIYIAMDCIWGGLVKAGLMNCDQAKAYGEFLARRYGSRPNIIWMIGGDIQGDIRTAEWDALANSIRALDAGHLMTFHPRGRTTSARWFNDRPWLDFNMFQSGHRRYNQRMGNKDYPIPDGTEEDSWMYVDSATVHSPLKPVLDGEPSYEDIPQGLHSDLEPRWTDLDVRRYAYWSVFAGSCGHTYGHNAIMQFVRPGVNPAYFADAEAKPWWKALSDPGRRQMKHLKHLILAFPYFDRVADSLIVRNNGIRYDRLLATRGADWLMVYNHTSRPMDLDLSRISGREKDLWLMNPADGTLLYIGRRKNGKLSLDPRKIDGAPTQDCVLIATDSRAAYLSPSATTIPTTLPAPVKKDLTE